MEKIKKVRLMIGAIILVMIIGGILIFEKIKNQDLNAGKIPDIAQDDSHNYQEPPTVVADAELSFDRNNVAVAVGSDFDLITRVNPGSNIEKGINAVQLDLTFDPAVFQLSAAKPISPFSEMGSAKIDNEKGSFSMILFIGGKSVTSISDLATLSFKAKKQTESTMISFAQTANVAVNDGSGSMALGTKRDVQITVSR